ncbi:LysM peptidoglycan-binding domain-containing protein [Salimicrobium sp. PL1-032A]|uniref:LysM peptidoglycan-binding domain-containing protein n=1 Tax=Salimicrobium sp. PL1-032A TaxID=3095364 RepID=UPI0032619B1C
MRRKTPVFLLIVLLMLAYPLTASAASSTFITNGNTSSKQIALTFDDGSDGTNIGRILSILDRENTIATFFLTGKGTDNHPASIRSIAGAGHEIANHSYSHPDFTTLSTTGINNELTRAEETIRRAIGKEISPLFRAPFGAVNDRVLQVVGDAGYAHTIHWDVDTLDWKGLSTTEVYNRIMDNVTAGSIILMHTGAGASGTPGAIERAIPELKRQGYTFTTVSGILSLDTSGTTHTVQAGDTLYSLARTYNTTVDTLTSLNNITDVTNIQVGQVLMLPGTEGGGDGSGSGNGDSYTVKPGDTLYSISKSFGVSVSAMAEANNISNPAYIRVGQQLTVPGTTSSSSYTVQAGDNMYRIALTHGVTLSDLARVNSIAPPYLIFPGQRLTIPN